MKLQPMAKAEDPDDVICRRNMVAFREEADLSQAAAAEASGVSVDNLRRYESGKTATVPGSVIAKLAEVYGHPSADFYNPNPPKAARPEDRPVFFLRTRPGAEVDEKTYAELLEVIAKANRETRGKRAKR